MIEESIERAKWGPPLCKKSRLPTFETAKGVGEFYDKLCPVTGPPKGIVVHCTYCDGYHHLTGEQFARYKKKNEEKKKAAFVPHRKGL